MGQKSYFGLVVNCDPLRWRPGGIEAAAERAHSSIAIPSKEQRSEPRPEPGYSRTVKLFHWLTVGALAAQFTVGYLMDAGDSGHGRGRGRGRGLGRGRGQGGELDAFGDDPLLTVHLLLGVTILVLVLARLFSRWRSTLPPWAEGLSRRERTLAHWTERTLYVVLLAIPTTGLWLVLVSDDALGAHVAAHIAFFIAATVHIGLVLKHQLINRDGLLRRML